jgi:hypothetical protein
MIAVYKGLENIRANEILKAKYSFMVLPATKTYNQHRHNTLKYIYTAMTWHHMLISWFGNITIDRN